MKKMSCLFYCCTKRTYFYAFLFLYRFFGNSSDHGMIFQVNLLSAYFLSFLLVCILYTHTVLGHSFLHFQLCCTPLHLLWLHWCCLKTENFFCQWQSSYNIFLLNYCLFQLAYLLYNILNIFIIDGICHCRIQMCISLVYVAQLFSLFHRILQVLEVYFVFLSLVIRS